MTITGKMQKDTPDDVCHECAQCYEDECRAYLMPHSKEEQIQREQSGCECDRESIRKIRREVHGTVYKTKSRLDKERG